MAIVLDDHLYCAPVIKDAITRRPGDDLGPFLGRGDQEHRRRARFGQLPVPDQDRRGVRHGPETRCGQRGQRHLGRRLLAAFRRGVHVHLLPPGGCDRGLRAGAQHRSRARRNGGVQRDADAAGHRRHHPDHRHGGRCERPGVRAHPGGDGRPAGISALRSISGTAGRFRPCSTRT